MKYQNIDDLPPVVFEKLLLMTIIGSLEGIRHNALSVDEAEGLLFIPYTVSYLKKRGCNTDIISIVEKACELEDFESLIPEKIEEIIVRLKEEAISLLSEYPEIEESPWT